MHLLKFHSCPSDPDVRMIHATKVDEVDLYGYVFLYTDDTLVVGENFESILRDDIVIYFESNEDSIGPPTLYLGVHLRKVQLYNGFNAWAFSYSQYLRAAFNNFGYCLSKE